MRNARAIRYALLGMVSRHPGGIHGYALKRQCDRILGHFWRLSFSEVYRVLDGLQGDGLLEEVLDKSSVKRKVVRVTDQGRCRLGMFILEPAADLPLPRRQELAIKLLFAGPECVHDLTQVINRQRDSCMEELHLLAAQRRKLRRVPVDPFVVNLLIDGAEGSVRAHVSWLDDISKKLMERFGARAT